MDKMSIYASGHFVHNILRMVIDMKHSDTYYYDVIRHNIKRCRETAGLTQQQLADRAGITMNYLAKIESKKMQRGFTLAIVGRIADALRIDIAELFKPLDE